MKNIKRIAAAMLAVAMLAVFAGCGDQSWSYRSGDISLTAGDYIYNLLNAYYEGYDKVESPDQVKKILDEEVTDSDGNKKTLEQYALDGADETTMKMIAVETLFKQYGLELEKTDYETSSTYADQIWGNIKDRFEKYGISQESFKYCYSEYGIKYGQVFEKLYGKDGEKAVPDDELLKYFKDKYMGYAYFSISMASQDENGNSVAKSDEEFKKTENSLKSYTEMINKKNETYENVVRQYMKDFEYTSDPTLSGSVNLEDTTMNETIVNALKSLNEGEATFVKSGEDAATMYYFVYKPKTDSIIDFLDKSDTDTETDTASENSLDDVTATSDNASDTAYVYPLKSGYTHYSLLNEMKSEDYDNYLNEFAKTITVEKNSNIVNNFKPKMFVEKSSDK